MKNFLKELGGILLKEMGLSSSNSYDSYGNRRGYVGN